MTETVEPATLALVGAGRLGGALARGWVSSGIVAPERLHLSSRTPATAQTLATDLGARAFLRNADAVSGAKIVVLGVKPYQIVDVLAEISPSLSPETLVVSLAAGTTLATLSGALPKNQPVVRALPNTPALVGEAATAFCRAPSVSEEHASQTQSLFDAVGVCVEVSESQMDAVVGVSASASAFVLLMIEALIDGGVRAGLPRATARTLAVQTTIGSGKLVAITGEHPAVLKDMVTTPGGTTMAGLEKLEQAAVRGAFLDAVMAASARATELSGKAKG